MEYIKVTLDKHIGKVFTLLSSTWRDNQSRPIENTSYEHTLKGLRENLVKCVADLMMCSLLNRWKFIMENYGPDSYLMKNGYEQRFTALQFFTQLAQFSPQFLSLHPDSVVHVINMWLLVMIDRASSQQELFTKALLNIDEIRTHPYFTNLVALRNRLEMITKVLSNIRLRSIADPRTKSDVVKVCKNVIRNIKICLDESM